MIRIRCKNCNVELTSTKKVQCCGCDNQMMIVDDKIGAINLDLVEIVNTSYKKNTNTILSNEDLQYQESRRTRKVRKMNFEER
jgi:hypothetical protein